MIAIHTNIVVRCMDEKLAKMDLLQHRSKASGPFKTGRPEP